MAELADSENYRAKYEAVLPQLKKLGWRYAIAVRSLATINFPLFFLLTYLYGTPSFVVSTLLGALSLGLVIASWRTTDLSTSSLMVQLQNSELATRLVTGQLEDDWDELFIAYSRRSMFKRRRSHLNTLIRIAARLPLYVASVRKPPEWYHIFLVWTLALIVSALAIASFVQTVQFSAYKQYVSIAVAIMTIVFCIYVSDLANKYLLLAGYLNICWDTPAADAPSSMEQNNDLVEERLRTGNLHMIINQLEQDFEFHGRMQGSPFFSPFVILLTSTIFSVSIGNEIDLLNIVLAGAMTSILLAVHISNQKWRTQYQEEIREQLKRSELAVLLLTGDVEDIEEYVPGLFKPLIRMPMLPKGYADNLRMRLWRAGFNLDWYLKPPRRLFRVAWVLNVVCMFLGMAAFFSGTFYFGFASLGRSPSTEMLQLGLFLVLWFSLLGASISPVRFRMRQRIWVTELIAYLRARLNAGTDSETT